MRSGVHVALSSGRPKADSDMGCNVSKDVKVDDQAKNSGLSNGLDQNQMSEQQAAEKIQASFRGYKTRKTLKDNGCLPSKDSDEKGNPGSKSKPNSAQLANDDAAEIVDIDLNDAELEKAAAKIQASYRHFSAKKKILDSESEPSKNVQETVKEQDEENLDDIDLTDPDVEKAALKIQSTFRGYKSRREPPTGETNAETEG